MDFTLENIEEAGRKYSGTLFYKLVQEFIKMGIVENIFNLKEGVRVYKTRLDEINIEFVRVNINQTEVDKETFKSILKNHQQGNTDFMTFCKEVGEVGVYKWVIDTHNMTCSYYDTFENLVLVEEIPSSK